MSERKYADEDFREVKGYSGYRVSSNGVVISKRFNRPLKQFVYIDLSTKQPVGFIGNSLTTSLQK